MTVKFEKLKKTIIKCNKCPRLVKFRKKISTEKRKQYMDQTYWGKPVTGFGDINGKIMIVGLAPAAHGGTRTGRVFTGDRSSDFLYKCLHNVKIANQSNSDHLNDGLKIKNTFITPALKCVPPGDKPESNELNRCSNYFENEIENLKNLKVIITLGKVAFDNCLKIYKKKFMLQKKFEFKHGNKYLLPDNKVLIACYHPSPRNVNTKLVTTTMINQLLIKAKKIAKI